MEILQLSINHAVISWLPNPIDFFYSLFFKINFFPLSFRELPSLLSSRFLLHSMRYVFSQKFFLFSFTEHEVRGKAMYFLFLHFGCLVECIFRLITFDMHLFLSFLLEFDCLHFTMKH